MCPGHPALQAVDLSALGAQAVAEVERRRKQAAAQLAAAMQHKPKLALHARLEGPKIAVPLPAGPDGQGSPPRVLHDRVPVSCMALLLPVND